MALRDATVWALCGWFDIGFDDGKSSSASSSSSASTTPSPSSVNPVTFTTHPDAPRTHWKQTVFLFEEGPLVVPCGHRIHGRLSCAKNPDNPRELIVDIRCTTVPAAGASDHGGDGGDHPHYEPQTRHQKYLVR